MPSSSKERIYEVANKYKWRNSKGELVSCLTDDEIKNLCVIHGTLTKEERDIISHHAVTTINMLEKMHFPKHLQRIPEMAVNHHEKMDGTGYPRGLKKEEMSIEARLMGVADVFEALTAKDRPYKRGKTLSEALKIMGQMKLNNHIDADIFDVFLRKKIYLNYAKSHMDDYQIDNVDLKDIPGYNADSSSSSSENLRKKAA
jgi:HD-GYP domain-containing protein (c-di-GMP phosphodiesterase class II)